MFERQLEARANVEVALVTDFALLIGKQVAALRRVMNGVATDAAHLPGRVGRAADLCLSYVFGVTPQAAADDLTRFQERKARDLRLVSHPLDVEFPRSVTAFTAGSFRRRVFERDRFEVRIPVEPVP